MNRMKRIYVCCILLILVLGLAAFNGLFTNTEGFSTIINTSASTGSCEKYTLPNNTTYWFCKNKNQSDALIKEGRNANNEQLAPADIICIRRNQTKDTQTTRALSLTDRIDAIS